MAMLNFEKIINLTTASGNTDPKLVSKLMIGHEPDNSIWQYYSYRQNVQDKSAELSYSNYTGLSWNRPTYSMTAHKCRNFGIKTFPDIGAMGFFTPLVGTSKFLIPIHLPYGRKYTAPTLSLVASGNNLAYVIVPPSDTTYTCYRIVLQNGYTTFEYITYELTGTIPKPTVKGDYTCWCIGYVDEGEATSYDSNFVTFNIATGPDVIQPVTPAYSLAANTYTKAEIDQMLGTISTLLDSINGEVI